jgi:hypothetical protein
LLIIWDGVSLHRGQAAQDFLSAGAAERLHREQLPAYAPERNPAEGVRRDLTRVEWKDVCCHDVPELGHELHLAIARLRRKPDVIRACATQRGYEV